MDVLHSRWIPTLAGHSPPCSGRGGGEFEILDRSQIFLDIETRFPVRHSHYVIGFDKYNRVDIY